MKIQKSTRNVSWWIVSLLVSIIIFIMVWNYSDDPATMIWAIAGIFMIQGVIFILPKVFNGNKKMD